MGIRILIPRPRGGGGLIPRGRLVWIALTAAACGVAYTLFGTGGMVGVFRARAEVDRLQQQVREAEAINLELAERAEGLATDPEAIEAEARERLGLVKPGETVYLLPPLPQEDPAAPGRSRPDPETRPSANPRQ